MGKKRTFLAGSSIYCKRCYKIKEKVGQAGSRTKTFCDLAALDKSPLVLCGEPVGSPILARAVQKVSGNPKTLPYI
jgi:hypothetical protein